MQFTNIKVGHPRFLKIVLVSVITYRGRHNTNSFRIGNWPAVTSLLGRFQQIWAQMKGYVILQLFRSIVQQYVEWRRHYTNIVE